MPLGYFSSRVFLGPAQRRLLARGLPVLAYHKIGAPPPGSRDPFLWTTPAEFSRHLARLQAAGFGSVSLDDWPIPKPGVVVTFDDGFQNVLRDGLPVLQQHGFRAIQFVIAGMIGGVNEWDTVRGEPPDSLMDEHELRDWLAAGQEIGSHGVRHRQLTKLSRADAREEIAGSKKKLEDLLGRPVRHFCYPYGRWNPALAEMVAEAGYATACTMEFGVNEPGASSWSLRRINPTSESVLVRKIIHRLRRRVFH